MSLAILFRDTISSTLPNTVFNESSEGKPGAPRDSIPGPACSNRVLADAVFQREGLDTLDTPKRIRRVLQTRGAADRCEHGVKSNFVRLYVYFVKDMLPRWEAAGDLTSDANIKGDDVDLLLP